MNSKQNKTSLNSKTSKSTYLYNHFHRTNDQIKKDDLLTKEEEYKRLNAELEKRTAHLVYEAEQVLKVKEKTLNEIDFINSNNNIDDFKNSPRVNCNNESIMNKIFEEKADKSEQNYDLFKKLEDDLDELNIMPKVANEMSNEAQIRFLKAKLKVMQEELENYSSEWKRKEEENFKLTQRCKELEEDRNRQIKMSYSYQTQIEKLKKKNEESNQKSNQFEMQLKTIKSENDQLKKDLKKYVQENQQQEIRINRLIEEIENLKLELGKQISSKKNLNEQEKIKLGNLQLENKRLHKQKLEFIAAFKKQLKLIDILKKQKTYLGATKIFQYCEQDFIDALEINSINRETKSNINTNEI